MSEQAVTAGGGSRVVLAQHPRAARHIRMAKGWGGLLCFLVAVLLSTRAGVPMTEALMRGVVAGLAGMVVCWGGAVVVWRQLALAELDAARRRVNDRNRPPMDPPPSPPSAEA